MSNPDQERVERYEALRTELADLDDAALKERFWQLCEEVMTPVVDLARTHTTPVSYTHLTLPTILLV